MDKVHPGYYAVIPADVRYDDRIPANAKLLYGEISALIGKDGFCFASNQYFADIYSCSTVTVSRLIGKLEEAGYIKRDVEKDKTGQVVRRKLYLSVSLPDVQPLNNFDNTYQQNCGEDINKNVKDTNTSITNIKKENKKEKSKSDSELLCEGDLRAIVIDSVREIAGEDWTRADMNDLYALVVELYNPDRAVRKNHPMRTKRSIIRLFSNLVKMAGNDFPAMRDLLDKAIANGWQSIEQPKYIKQSGRNPGYTPEKPREEVQYRCI